MTGSERGEIDGLIDWIIGEGLSENGIEDILGGLVERLLALGYPLVRVSVAMPSIDPMQRGFAVVWFKDTSLSTEVQGHGEAGQEMFERSPIFYLLSNDLLHGRWRLPERTSTVSFPLFDELAAFGATDYIMKLVPFPGETALEGVGISFAVDAPNGFTDEQIAAIDRLTPALGLVCSRIAAMRVATDMLAVYTGTRTSGRILKGETRRGGGEAIHAAILFADLKNFTSLNEAWAPGRIVTWLNESFEAIVNSVEEHGGEVLKFMGDSVLAIFPVDNGEPADACARALSAAQAAMRATETLNRSRVERGEPAILADIALHVGEVFYGNVGASRRLDFTAIGSAVNEAARIEKLADTVGHSLLASAAFAAQVPEKFRQVGTFPLRGVAKPADVFAWRD
ncbi:adenylate/guanylate cyclase domain-containing protein [Rhizobium sp. S152]|uniref:adenylate/guanylate cyclase domain-containing protein n=1 Tax=Rhizobium sp. S152 TaxID=3055038 RepID=UPI0025A97EEE|nr:adenylate/guanylate cyclase domain-containing protein [Rhizobium sp. S152]MDM9625416.1 adenylate/guanylate cyclase domain-containing protein [Rhizobium sp. S152]